MIKRWSEIYGRSQQILRVLLGSNAPVSGRRVADVLNISPTTAGNGLKALLDRGLVNAQPAGAAVLWSANEASAEVRALRRDLESSTRANSARVPVPADVLAWTLPPPGTKPVLKVVVLTALASEFASVRSHLAEATLRRTRSGTRYDVGVVRGKHLDWEVHLAEVGMGNSGAAAEVADAVDAVVARYHPHLGLPRAGPNHRPSFPRPAARVQVAGYDGNDAHLPLPRHEPRLRIHGYRLQGGYPQTLKSIANQ